MNNGLFLSAFLLIIFNFVSCSVLNSTKTKSAKNEIYKIKAAPKTFKNIDDKNIDYVFNNQNGSYLIGNSECGRFEPGNLEKKTNRLLKSFDEELSRTSHEIKLNKYKALQTIANVKKGNDFFTIEIVTFEKDTCLIDIYYLSPQANYNNKIFKEFLNSVVVF
jgi:hypothetical protein